jgi:hypothetical protein
MKESGIGRENGIETLEACTSRHIPFIDVSRPRMCVVLRFTEQVDDREYLDYRRDQTER